MDIFSSACTPRPPSPVSVLQAEGLRLAFGAGQRAWVPGLRRGQAGGGLCRIKPVLRVTGGVKLLVWLAPCTVRHGVGDAYSHG